MHGAADDVLDLLDYAWARLRDRLDGLSDEEWQWLSVADDPRVSIRWRVEHITELLADERNWTWLALPGGPASGVPSVDAASAVARLSAAFERLRSALAASDVDVAFMTELGPAAGPYATSSRLSYLLHVVDELVHHGAETALLRDLYAGRRSS